MSRYHDAIHGIVHLADSDTDDLIDELTRYVDLVIEGEPGQTQQKIIEMASRIVMLEHDLATERRHADSWQRLAGCYDEIRYALRNAPDTREGHAEFYNECSRLIFGGNHD